MPMPEIKQLEFVRSFEHISGPPGPDRDLTWFLIYTGALFFCVGGTGMHSILFTNLLEKIPSPPAPNDWKSKMNSVVAAGRIKGVQGAQMHHLWGSKDLCVETPREWRPELEKILEEQVIPKFLATS